MLQFQSRGTLAATSGPPGAVGTKPAGVMMGVEGAEGGRGGACGACGAASEAVEPDDWRLCRTWVALASWKQWLQARETGARGFSRASWSRGST